MTAANLPSSASRLALAVALGLVAGSLSILHARNSAQDPLPPTPEVPTHVTPPDPAPDAKPKSPRSDLSWGDSHFLRQAAQDGDEEVRIASIAVERATRPEVKAFAQRVAQERKTENDQLAALATQKGLDLAAPTDTKAETPTSGRLEKKWTGKDPKDFDTDYVNQEIDAHESAVKHYESHLKSDDPDVAALASQTLPVLQQRLRLVQQLKRSLPTVAGEPGH